MRLWRRRSIPESGNAVNALAGESAFPAARLALTALMADAALNDPSEDRLSRAGFAERLAQTMTERGQAGSVVGLYADWGEGKSTVLGFVEHYLTHQPHPAVVIHFNPWFDSDESAVLKQFFAAVAAGLGVDLRTRREKAGDWVRKINPFLKTVAPSIAPSATLSKHLEKSGGLDDLAKLADFNTLAKAADFRMGPVNLGGLLEAVGNALGEPTLRNLRDRLRKLLTKEASGRNRRVVVLIDDVDRLEASQVATVFRMIKLAADFPMLSVLTAFAPLPVAEALGARFGGGGDPATQGAAFLEKIVQVPVRLPPADPDLVAALMQDLLGQVIQAHCGQLPTAEQARLDTALDSCVWPLVTTLRVGKQLLSKADFALPVMRGEVNPCDQVILQALELLHPDLYRFIATNKALLVDRPGPSEFRTARISKIDQVTESLPPASRGRAKELLQLLFPHLQSLYSNTWYEPHQEEEWAREKRVCSPAYFSRFFAFALPVGDILDSEIEAVINTPWPGNGTPLAALLAGQDPRLVLQKLAVHSTGLSATRSLDVARAVAATWAGPLVSVGRPFEAAFSAGMLISRLLQPLPSDERQAACTEIVDLAEPGLAAITMLAIEAAGRDNTAVPERLLDDSALRAVGAHLVTRWFQMPPATAFGDSAGAVQIFAVWRRYGDVEDARTHLSAALASSLPLLILLLSGYLPGASGGPLVSLLDRGGYQSLREMLPASAWVAAIEQHFPGVDAAVQREESAPTQGASALRLTVPAPVLAFLFVHHSAQAQVPPTPASVFEPTMQRRSQVQMHSPRHLLSTSEPSRPTVIVRACVVRPGELLNTGEAASTVAEAARRTLLRQLLTAHDPARTFEALVAGAPWNVTSRPEWKHVGGAGREMDTFNIGDVNDVTAFGYSASVTIRTGLSSTPGGAPPLPAIMGTVDLQLHLRDDRVLTLVELRDLLVDAMAAVPLTRKAADGLLPTGPFAEGELGLWIASNSVTGLQDVIDLGHAAPNQPPLPEVELYSDLQKWAIDPGTRTAVIDNVPEATRLAVELLQRCFQRTNREDYEQQLNALLP